MNRSAGWVIVAWVFSLGLVHAATVEATTADGKVVLLSPDGTWKYKDAPAKLEAAGGLVKPASATSVIKSTKGFLELWYDPAKWSTMSSTQNPSAEFVLKHAGGDGYVMAVVERIAIPLANLRNVALGNARAAAPDAKIVLEEERTVNGVKVLCLQIEGTLQGIPFKYYGYYWSGKAGTLQLLAYTSQNLFDEYRDDFTDLLDGMTITKE